jgi:hypothetical protein
MSGQAMRIRTVVLVFALVVVLLAGQWAAAAAAPSTGIASTGRVLGKTGFAYLGGIRTFVAAALWNRLDPQFHEYYGGRSLTELDFMLPTMRLVVALDPQFTQAYQVSSFIIFKKLDESAGIEIAREGVDNNPRSGSMRSNLAQLLLLADPDENRDEIRDNVRMALSPGTVWASDAEEYEGLAIMRAALVALDVAEDQQAIRARLDELKEHGAEIGDHDHDHDGKQDH